MNIRLLDTLLQLFALVAKKGGYNVADKQLVYRYLVGQFNEQLATKYIGVFENYLLTELELDIEAVCRQFNSELDYNQKLLILIKLIELVYTDSFVSDEETKTLNDIAHHFNIPQNDFERLYQFITTNEPHELELSLLLHIDAGQRHYRPYHIQAPNLKGSITALLVTSANMYLLRYTGPATIFINGQQMQPQAVYPFNPGHVIRSTRVSPIYYSDVVDEYLHRAANNKTVLEIRDLTYHFDSGAQAIFPFDLVEEAGRMVAIMGASGAGKSTLLSVLNGSHKPSGGSVKINGMDVHGEARELEGMIGYVSQEDLLIEELTVYQNLYLNARLCFGAKSKIEIELLVKDKLEEIGLFESKDLVVGNALNPKISGGQRKRLNIALELIREPAVLFVDEPTSGLSSFDSENVMDLLAELAHRGKLIFVVIHQPSSDIFKQFDKLLVMDKGGYPVFYGNPLDSISFFRKSFDYVNSDQVECQECGNVKPDQIFNILESKVVDVNGKTLNVRRLSPSEWYKKFKQNHKPDVANIPKQQQRPGVMVQRPGLVKQFQIFLLRDFLTKISKPTYLSITFLVSPILALVMALLLKASPVVGEYSLYYNENLPTYIFISILSALFIGMTQSAEEILRDRKVLQREAYLHLSRLSYLTAKTTILFGISAIQTLLYVLIGNFILEIPEMYGHYWFMLFTVTCFANLLGMNISATFNEAVTVYILVPLLLIPQILLGGAMVSFSKLNPMLAGVETVPLVGDLMASRWAYEGLAVYQFKHNRYNEKFYDVNQAISLNKYKIQYWKPSLLSKIEYCKTNYRIPVDSDMVKTNLQLLRKELSYELTKLKSTAPLADVNKLIFHQFDTTLANKTISLLNALESFYQRRLNRAFNQKDSIVRSHSAQMTDLRLEQMKYDNERLDQYLTNFYVTDKIIAINDRLLETSDPIYVKPARDGFSLNYRTHFYSPVKPFLGFNCDSYWFNAGVLWFFSILLYLGLYYEVYRKAKKKINLLFGWIDL